MSEELRVGLQRAATPGWDDDVRASAALYAGKKLHHVRRTRRVAAAGMVLGVAALGFLIVNHESAAPDNTFVLGCSSAVAAQGSPDLGVGINGVTLQVSNATGELAQVVAGRTHVIAFPGVSQVTLPLAPGDSTVRCGTGEAVRVHVGDHGSSRCSIISGRDDDVQTGSPDRLTRARLGPTGAGSSVVEASNSTDLLRRVQVRAHGAVLAEAVWHALPGGAAWQLQTLTRCP